MQSLTPRQAIELWKNNQIDGAGLMRQLVSHEKWSVPISEAAAAETLGTNALKSVMYSKNQQGRTRLYLFSGDESYNIFLNALRARGESPSEQHFVTTRGSWVFCLPIEGMDELVVDPASPWEVVYNKEQFAGLRRCAGAVEIEATLAALRAGTAEEGALWQVKNYDGYSLFLVKSGEKILTAMAPDDKGRALLAVFTLDDNAAAYFRQARHAEGELVERTLPGPELFQFLSQLQADGIVFNCCGPAKPVAFALPFAAIAAKAQDGKKPT